MGNMFLKVILFECWLRLTHSVWILVKCSQIMALIRNNSPWSILIHLDRFHKHRFGKLMKVKKKASVHSSSKMQCTEIWLTSLLCGLSRWICNREGGMFLEIGAASWNRKHISVNTSGCICFFLRIKTDVFSLTAPHVWSPLRHFSLLPVAIVSK